MNTKRAVRSLAAACLATLILTAPAVASYPAQGNFGVNGFDVTVSHENGSRATEAGAHPFALTVSLQTNMDKGLLPEGWLKDIFVEQMPGLVGDTTAYPRCTSLQFLQEDPITGVPTCPEESQVGISASATSEPGLWSTAPVYNLDPPPGVLLRLGFKAAVPRIVIDVSLDRKPPNNPIAASRNTPQAVAIYGSKIQLWGYPADEAHDRFRGNCGLQQTELPPGEIAAFQFENQSGESCGLESRQPRPFLTLPTHCGEALATSYEAISWEGESDVGSALTHDEVGNPQPFTGCGGLPAFDPSISAQPTSKAAESPTGLDLSLSIRDEGLTSPSVEARAKSDIRKVVLTLPQGMTANPSLAEGLEVCSEADLGRETLEAPPGEGCPKASKIGTIEVTSPLVEEPIRGTLFQATPYKNLAGDSLIAFYIVLKNPKLGIVVKQPVRVEADPVSGQLRGITEDIPQLPFSSFSLHFREGGRSPLVSPPTCGSHTAEAEVVPWSGQPAAHPSSSFELIAGPDGRPCPDGGQPFEPGFAAGSQDNDAGSYSPFSMRLTRRDGDQDLTRFDATLPPGVVARLSGVSQCSDAQIARAKAKSGRAELASPSCPANSRIGSVQSGAGVGSQLTYVPGTVYLAGPFGGAPLSVVGIVPAVAGPFDVGTVVVRQALQIDPRSAEVRVDGAHSDPIPHILAGIPLRVREIQVSVDRPGFTLNPTSCDPFATTAAIWGGGENPFSILDDHPVDRSAHYQAASCRSLAFKPRLALRLRGGTRRGAHPALRGVYRPHKGNSNLKRLVLRLPHSAFLDQAHIRTVCTRVQFAAGPGHGARCPGGAIYGRARAFTPLLSEPLEGPVFLRSSNHKLPDMVAALHGIVDVEAVARIDSKRGGIRATFSRIPDVPLSRVIVNMQGGRKGLIVNSATDLCAAKHRANVRFTAHNAKRAVLRSLVRPRCPHHRAHRHHQRP